MNTPLTIALSSLLCVGAARQEGPKPTPPPTKAVAGLEMTLKGGVLGVVSVQAKQVETRFIVDRLKAELKIPIDASRVVAEHKIDLVIKQGSTADLLRALAPLVLVDQEVAAGEEPVWTAIHLLGFNEREPPSALKQSGFLIFAGVLPESADDSPEALEEKANAETAKALEQEPKDGKPFLIVSVTPDQRVSLKARQQPLIAILNEVASKVTVPIDLRGEVDLVPIDIDLRAIPLRDLGVALGRPGFRLVVRRNLASGEDRVQGILVGQPPKTPLP